MKPCQLRSAGGVLITVVANTPYTVVLHRRNPDEWRLPKGKLRAGETPQQAAVREVAEETGIGTEAHELLGKIEYEYREPQTDQMVYKQVAFYLTPLPEQQSIQIETTTFAEGLWLPVPEAIELLTFPAERRIVQQAIARLARQSG